jgi:flagellar basal-body rod modification protein FlgD
MHSISANYTMPTILNALTPAAGIGLQKTVGARSAAGTTGTNSSTSSSDATGGLGTTFLSLLAQELQNQDPTAPVDPTAMVGQMISLNQLEQLIGINQTLTGVSTAGATGATHPTGAGQAVAGAASSAALAAANSGIASMLSPSAAGAATTQLPFDPSTMMPLGFGNAGAIAASINSSINAAAMGFSGTNNNTSGGK